MTLNSMWLLLNRLSEFPGEESVLPTVRVHLLPSGAKRPWRPAESSSQRSVHGHRHYDQLLPLCQPFHGPLRVLLVMWGCVPGLPSAMFPAVTGSGLSGHPAELMPGLTGKQLSRRAVHSSPRLSPSPCRSINIPFFGPQSRSERDPLIGAG